MTYNIEMKHGKQPNRPGSRAWWWQVKLDGVRVHRGVGWASSKQNAYGTALDFMRRQKRADAEQSVANR